MSDLISLYRDRFIFKIKQIDENYTIIEDELPWKDQKIGPICDKIFLYSPYLSDTITQFPFEFIQITKIGGEEYLATLIDSFLQLSFNIPIRRFSKELRFFKRKAHLAIAWCDLYEKKRLSKITGLLSQFADLAISKTVDKLLYDAYQRQEITLENINIPTQGTGLIILALGKLGAYDLNYSSDIDLVCFYEEKFASDPAYKSVFLKLIKNLVTCLEERTEHGYVFRVDLRLRPDPGATPIIMSDEAALQYYGSVGQNWERAAFIRSRTVAGDLQASERFLEMMKKFVWRRNLDFDTIQDIHSIKRQMDSKYKIRSEDLYDFNIKLGQGGIRHIEFYIQTQQLIYGGKEARLRVNDIEKALKTLYRFKFISKEASTDVLNAYRYFRMIEHRLQMINDEQTHSLPDTTQKFEALALFCGEDSAKTLKSKIKKHLNLVKKYSSDVFKEAPPLSNTSGSLVFTGTDEDPATLHTLKEMGFSDPVTIIKIVKTWHHGRYRCLKSLRARQILTELIPVILKNFSRTVYPQEAFVQFDQFLSLLPYGLQVFSLIQSNPDLLVFVAKILGFSPKLGQIMARKPNFIENFLNNQISPDLAQEGEKLAHLLVEAPNYEDQLTNLRKWTNDLKFMAGVNSLFRFVPLQDYSLFLTDLAEFVLKETIAVTRSDFMKKKGTEPFKKVKFCLLGLGNLGAQQMLYDSDLDLMLIYDIDDERQTEIHPLVVKFIQRLMTALTANMNEGKLYDVDWRLRPLGDSGPLAVYIKRFEDYYQKDAWIFEYMALTRARIIYGSGKLASKITNMTRGFLSKAHDPIKLKETILDLRAQISKQHPSEQFYLIKYYRGGLIDIEFICQYLTLTHAHTSPDILSHNIFTSLEKFEQFGIFSKDRAYYLYQVYRIWRKLYNTLQLTLHPPYKSEAESQELGRILMQAFESDHFLTKEQKTTSAEIEKTLILHAKQVKTIFDDIFMIGD